MATETVSSTTQKHDADQAGGEKEVVYSSDGSDSTKVTFPPNVGNAQTHSGGEQDVITTEGIKPESAFEVFSGKFFATSNNNKKGYSTLSESPLQRLGRIQQELNELQDFVTTSGSDNEVAGFSKQVGALRDQWSLLSDAQSKQNERLIATIDSSIAGLSSPDKNQVQSKTSTIPAISTISNLEERLKKLELAIGSGSVSTGSVVDRIKKLENLQSKLDSKQADQLQKKAKVIRQDLEAASKARNKLMTATAGSSSMVGVEDSKTIAALYDQLQSLSGISDHLPILAQRLQVLAQQHTSASTWDTRLHATESVLGTMETHVSAIESAIQNLETSVQQNANQMKTNVQALDERLEKLMKK